jgi:hypothetical protein
MLLFINLGNLFIIKKVEPEDFKFRFMGMTGIDRLMEITLRVKKAN